MLDFRQMHLYRLTPVGKDVAYDPAGPEEERDKAVKAWRDLIPPGQLPKEKSSTPPGAGRVP